MSSRSTTTQFALVSRGPDWISTGDSDLAARYREIMAEARRDREIVQAIDLVRRSA